MHIFIKDFFFYASTYQYQIVEQSIPKQPAHTENFFAYVWIIGSSVDSAIRTEWLLSNSETYQYL